MTDPHDDRLSSEGKALGRALLVLEQTDLAEPDGVGFVQIPAGRDPENYARLVDDILSTRGWVVDVRVDGDVLAVTALVRGADVWHAAGDEKGDSHYG